MKKNFKLALISLFLFLISICPVYALKSSTTENHSKNFDNVNLIIDNKNIETLPDHFRKTTDLSLMNMKFINLEGMNNLNISGSQQFSPSNIDLILKNIDTKLPFIVVDLRQESHGFINCLPVSYENEHNNANSGLSISKVLIKEKHNLSKIKLGKQLSFYNDDCTIIPTIVQNERNICSKKSLGYIRITATDEIPPSPQDIDYFIEMIKKRPKQCWYHFHCKEGIGRTTSFMIFYDMMKNYDKVSENDLILRQIAIAPNFSDDDIKDLSSERRIKLFHLFYEYCSKYGKDFSVSFSKYLKENDLSYDQ